MTASGESLSDASAATGGVWRVRDREGTPVGGITVEEADFPWLSGTFAPGPGFAAVKHLFAREIELLGPVMEEASDEQVDAWEAAYDAVRAAVTLESPSGPVAEFLLHVDGDQAWFRWNDEPFED
ncbi:hypothetical protein [Streptomyces sp. NPDC047434]|uniref:hypothetical protein n=1 Tax=Streptomyces sp. NPDC047434 TaxID=3155143 RepID=UPI0034031515